MGRLDIRIVEARNLPTDSLTSSAPDAYVTCEIDHQKFQSTVCQGRQNPKWDDVLKFTVADPSTAQLVLKVFNKGTISDDYLGEYRLNIDGLTKGLPREAWYLLKQCKTNAEIKIAMIAIDFGNEIPEEMTAVTGQIVGGHSTTFGNKNNNNNAAAATTAPIPAPPPPPQPGFQQPQWNPEIQQHHQPNEAEIAIQKVGKQFESALGGLVASVNKLASGSSNAGGN